MRGPKIIHAVQNWTKTECLFKKKVGKAYHLDSFDSYTWVLQRVRSALHNHKIVRLLSEICGVCGGSWVRVHDPDGIECHSEEVQE